jgi:hypothetical protein
MVSMGSDEDEKVYLDIKCLLNDIRNAELVAKNYRFEEEQSRKEIRELIRTPLVCPSLHMKHRKYLPRLYCGIPL